MLFPADDAAKLDAQEKAYNIESHTCKIYDDDENVDGTYTLVAQVYAPKKMEPEGNPQSNPSERYRNVLLDGAKTMKLAPC